MLVSTIGMKWHWSLTGPYLPPELQLGYGLCDTLDAAKVEFRAKFDAWLAWAFDQGGVRTFHGADSTAPDGVTLYER